MRSTENYVDVTARFFAAVDAIERGRVKVSPYFDMLDGARALEVGNPRLDTGLIHLSDAELQFDTAQPQLLATVVGVMNELVVLYTSWINGLSLLVTVLACRYVLDFLHNYKAQGLLRAATMVNPRLHREHPEGDSVEHGLVNVVLRAYVVGMCKLIGSTIRIGINVLYDEEDLTTRSMDLDFLLQVLPQIAAAEVELAEKWLAQQELLRGDTNYSTAMDFLRMAKNVAQLERVWLIEIDFPHQVDEPYIPYIDGALEALRKLQKLQLHHSVPTGAVSRFVQLDSNNKNIPCDIVRMDDAKAYEDLVSLLDTVRTMVHDFYKIHDMAQLQSYLRYSVSLKMSAQANAVARGIFQLFFIRDDKSILGLNERVSTLSIRFMEMISACGNPILEPAEWNIQGDNASLIRAQCQNLLLLLFDDVEAAFYLLLNVVGNNRCRQRQLQNKNIILWDSLQFKAENTELELFSHGIGDRLSPSVDDQPALGISSFVFYIKLEIMIEVALSGFEHNIYKEHEADLMFWYASELLAQLHQHIGGRIRDINQGKIQLIQSLQKRIKKTKAGPKKDAMKRNHKYLVERVLPQLENNIILIDKVAAPAKLGLFHLCIGIAYTIQLMRVVFHMEQSLPEKLVDEESQFKLRMKPWSSVGTPELPSFEKFQRERDVIIKVRKLEGNVKKAALQALIASAKRQLTNANRSIKEVFNSLETETLLKSKVSLESSRDVVDWYSNVIKTSDMYQAQLAKMTTILDLADEYEAKPVKGYSSFFPIYSITKK